MARAGHHAKHICQGWLPWHTFIMGYWWTSWQIGPSTREKPLPEESCKEEVTGFSSCKKSRPSFFYHYCCKNTYYYKHGYCTVSQTHSQNHTREMPHYQNFHHHVVQKRAKWELSGCTWQQLWSGDDPEKGEEQQNRENEVIELPSCCLAFLHSTPNSFCYKNWTLDLLQQDPDMAFALPVLLRGLQSLLFWITEGKGKQGSIFHPATAWNLNGAPAAAEAAVGWCRKGFGELIETSSINWNPKAEWLSMTKLDWDRFCQEHFFCLLFPLFYPRGG